jgi:hypothetical protein
MSRAMTAGRLQATFLCLAEASCAMVSATGLLVGVLVVCHKENVVHDGAW